MASRVSGKLSDTLIQSKLGSPTQVAGKLLSAGPKMCGKLTDTHLTGIMEYGIEVV